MLKSLLLFSVLNASSGEKGRQEGAKEPQVKKEAWVKSPFKKCSKSRTKASTGH